MNILHIIDDHKFIKICEETFDISGLNNFFLKSGEISLQFISKNKIEVIFIHFLRSPEINFFYKNRVKAKTIWMSWGADAFNLPLFYNDFLDSDSKELALIINKSQGYKRLTVHLIKIIFKKLINIFSTKKIKVINSFDYIVPIVPGDYYILKERYGINTPMFHFNYVTKLIDNQQKTGHNIILGNSATISNNHWNIINKLQKINIGDTKIYIPLNYGNKTYRKYILNKIKNDNKFVPIIDFIPFEEYNKIIKSCGIMLMNHERQQALGNVILGLMNGCTIYLNEKSSLYHYLIECGFIIQNIAEFDLKFRITTEQILINVELAKRYFGKDMQTNKIKKLLNKVYE